MFAGLIVGISLFLIMTYHMTAVPGAYVLVTQEGEEIMQIPLTEEQQILLTSERGTNLLVVKDGEAWIEEADCPDLVCARTRPISKKGETLCCLPHKLVVEICGAGEGEYDAITR